MKIVFFSDIHGNKYVIPTFLREIKKENPDKIVFCGDIFGYYYYQNEIINFFRNSNFIVLLGNHEQYFLDLLNGLVDMDLLIKKYGNSYCNIQNKISLENVKFIESLKPQYEFKADGCNIAVFHGSPEDNLNGRIYPDTVIKNTEYYSNYDYVVLGHTHHKMERKVGKCIVLNPGSIGQQRDGKGCSYLVLDTASQKYYFKIINFPVEKLIKDIDFYDPENLYLKEVLRRNINK